MSSEKYLWVEQFSPTTVKECLLPSNIKETFEVYVKEKEFPNIIMAGPAGVGKTSLARALCNEVSADLLFVNASLDRGIGEIRNNVATFASCASMFGGVKVVLLDEADNLTADSQKALRALIEEFQNHCRFILTCNYPHNIIDAIHSRCSVYDFNVRNPKDLKKLSIEFAAHCAKVLQKNDVKFNPKVLMEYVESMAPDWRGILNNLQGNTKTGTLDETILKATPDGLMPLLKAKKWADARDWVFEYSYLHPKVLESQLYKAVQKAVVDQSKPTAVLLFGQYSDKIDKGADPSITILALVTEIMMECQFK